MTSILSSKYIEPDRPYSDCELEDKRRLLHKRLYIGTRPVYHSHCGHFYLLKKNSRREKDLEQTGNNNQGNCSVCWRIHKTSFTLREKAKALARNYTSVFDQTNVSLDNKSCLSYENMEIEKTYYIWLYEEIPDKRKRVLNYKKKE